MRVDEQLKIFGVLNMMFKVRSVIFGETREQHKKSDDNKVDVCSGNLKFEDE